MADSNLVDFRSNTTFGRIYSFADDFKNSAGVNNLDEQLRLDRQRFADHAAGRAPLPPKESLALRDRIEKTTKLLNPGAQNVWGVLSEAESAWQDEVKAASRMFANTIGMLAGGPALAVLPASGRMLGASEDIIEKLAEVNIGAAGVYGIPKPASLPWVHPISGRLVHRSADLSQPLYGRRADDFTGKELVSAPSRDVSSRATGAVRSQVQTADIASAPGQPASRGVLIKTADRAVDQSEDGVLRLPPPKAPVKTRKKKKKVAKAGTFVKRTLPEPEVIAEAKVRGEIFRGTNQLARQNRDASHLTEAADDIKSRVGYQPEHPNTNMYNAHAEVEAMQKAFEAGVTHDADMVIRLTGKNLCGFCEKDVVLMAKRTGLKSLRVEGPNKEVFTWAKE